MREHKKRYSTPNSNRPEIASLRLEKGHWEGFTVVGKRTARESVIFSLLETKTQTYLAFRIFSKTSAAVVGLMNTLHDAYGERFSHACYSTGNLMVTQQTWARCSVEMQYRFTQKNGHNKTNRPPKEAVLSSFEGRFLCIILDTGYFATYPFYNYTTHPAKRHLRAVVNIFISFSKSVFLLKTQ